MLFELYSNSWLWRCTRHVIISSSSLELNRNLFCSSCLFRACLGAPWRWFTTVIIRIMAAKETRINNMTRARCRAHVGGHVSWPQAGRDVEQEPVEPSQPPFFHNPAGVSLWIKTTHICEGAFRRACVVCVCVSRYKECYSHFIRVCTLGHFLFALFFRN